MFLITFSNMNDEYILHLSQYEVMNPILESIWSQSYISDMVGH